MSAIERYDLLEHGVLRFLTAGSVDDGKSTLIGRLLYDTKAILADQLAAIERTSQKRGTALDLSLLTDGLVSCQMTIRVRRSARSGVAPVRLTDNVRSWLVGRPDPMCGCVPVAYGLAHAALPLPSTPGLGTALQSACGRSKALGRDARRSLPSWRAGSGRPRWATRVRLWR